MKACREPAEATPSFFLGPLYIRNITSISSWINNHMLSKVWSEITNPCRSTTVKVGNYIPYVIMDVITYPSR